MEITGKLIQILEPQSGTSARGEWKKQEFIIETEEQYPRKVCIANWNDKVDINNINVGTPITVSVNLESREFNGKWYTDVKAWRMETASDDAIHPSANMGNMPPPPPPPPSEQDASWESDSEDVGDLPF